LRTNRDVDRRVQDLLSELVWASICDSRAAQLASAKLRRQNVEKRLPVHTTPSPGPERERLTVSAGSDD
jgi:hypothetical protein